MKVTSASAAAICIATWLFGASAQATGAIAQRGQDRMGQDEMARTPTKDISYTGCVEVGQKPRTYVLTDVTPSDDRMGRDAMAKDAMARDAKTSSLSIASQAVDLSAHVGHKVTVSGNAAGTMDAMKKDPMSKDSMSKDAMSRDAMTAGAPAFDVKTIKTIASSCR
jgi:pentapeptide MXKDX repeat protein